METLKEGDYAIMISIPTTTFTNPCRVNDIVKIVRIPSQDFKGPVLVDIFNLRLKERLDGYYIERFKKIDINSELIDLINL